MNIPIGVFENTAVDHDNTVSTSLPSRIDVPLGSIRFSHLRDDVVTHKGENSQQIIEQHELKVSLIVGLILHMIIG